VDRSLIDVGARASVPLPAGRDEATAARSWLSTLSAEEKDRILLELIEHGEGPAASLRARAIAATRPAPTMTAGGRSVDDLLEGAEDLAEERRAEDARAAARELAAALRREEEARAKYLDDLSGRAEEVWARLDALIDTNRQKDYAEAVRLLVDLRDLAHRAGTDENFASSLSELRTRHAAKTSLLRRLKKASLA
jgi:hypothetical protein